MKRGGLAAVKVVVAVACLVPLGWLVLRAGGWAGFDLGPNPVEELIHRLGKTGLNLLVITLAVTPLRIVTGWNWLVRLRRMLGLFAFFYLVLHLMSYVGIDQRFNWPSLLVDVAKRPYITIGMLAIVLLIPLAATSTQAMQRRLGRRWKQLHRLIYVIVPLGVVHYWWQSKADIFLPFVYGVIVAGLLAFRLINRRLRRRRALQ